MHVAVKRFFDFGWKDTDATLFQSGGQWAGCGRLFPIIEGVMEYELGPRLGWPDLAAGFHRELWRGEYDNDVASLAVALPSGLDSRGMSTRVKDMLKPLARTFMLLQAKPAVVLATPTEETEVTPATLGDPSVTDVTGALEASKGMSGEEEKDLAANLAADAKNARAASASKALCAMAAQTLREKLVVLPDTVACKKFMETEQGGLHARTIFIDATMPQSRQTGPKSRQLCLEPTLVMQRTWASRIKTLPATPVVGHVLARPGQGSCEDLTSSSPPLTHTTKRSLFPWQCPKNTCDSCGLARSELWDLWMMTPQGLISGFGPSAADARSASLGRPSRLTARRTIRRTAKTRQATKRPARPSRPMQTRRLWTPTSSRWSTQST